jgi:hypothetical protein
MGKRKNGVIRLLQRYGVHFSDVVRFLTERSRLERGFEAQIVGVQTTSPTTSGIVTYVLNQLNELPRDEQERLTEELLSFQVGDAWLDSDFTDPKYTNVWASSQCLLGLLSMDEPPVEPLRPTVNWLRRMQEYSGGWSFSGNEPERIVYLPYVLLVFQLYEDATKEEFDATLNDALSFAEKYTPQNEIEKVIRTWCLNRLNEDDEPPEPTPEPDYTAILRDEFADYVVHEHSIYPFSFKYYMPATYLFTRQFTKPTHPFNLWLVKYLVEYQLEEQAWTHVQPISDPTAPEELEPGASPFTYCTALALYTLYSWGEDVLAHGAAEDVENLPAWDSLVRRLHE